MNCESNSSLDNCCESENNDSKRMMIIRRKISRPLEMMDITQFRASRLLLLRIFMIT